MQWLIKTDQYLAVKASWQKSKANATSSRERRDETVQGDDFVHSKRLVPSDECHHVDLRKVPLRALAMNVNQEKVYPLIY